MTLEERVAELERMRYLKLRELDLLRLQPGDIVVLRITRPLAESERALLVHAWTALMERSGHAGTEFVILAGADLDLSIMRKENAVGAAV